MNESVQYLEDLAPGMRFAAPTWTLSEADIYRFAREFDPQPFHLDPEAANRSLFRGLAASGWHTAASVMAMGTRSEFRPAGGIVGVGVDELRFIRPVRPGDTLRLEIEVTEIRLSASNPRYGLVRCLWQAYNQHDEPVIEMKPLLWVQRREHGDGAA